MGKLTGEELERGGTWLKKVDGDSLSDPVYRSGCISGHKFIKNKVLILPLVRTLLQG